MPNISQKFSFDASGVSRSLTNITKGFNNATNALNNLNNAANNAKGLNSIVGGAKKAQGAVGRLTVSWQTLARIVSTQITVRLFAGFVSQVSQAIQSARDLGTAIAEIKTISGTLPVGDLTNEVLALSSALGQASQEVAEGVYQTLSNQVVDATHAMEFYEKAARLANVTNAESADTVNALSSVMNSYNLAFEDTDAVMDSLFKTIEIGRIRMGDMANAIGRVTPLAAQMGVSWNEVAAALAVMTRQGVNVSTAVTQMRSVLQKLLRPGEEMQALFEKWNVETAPQAIQKFGGLEGVFKAIAKETGNDAKAIGELFQRVRSITGYMAAATDGGKTYAEALREIGDAGGAAKQAIEEFENTDAFRNRQAVEDMKNAWTEIGMTLLPIATGAAYGFKGALELLQGTLNLVTFGMTDFKVELDKIYPGLSKLLGITDDTAKAQAALEETAKRVAAAYGKDMPQAFDDTKKAYADWVSDVRKKEGQVRKSFEESVKAANKRLKVAADGIVGYYSDSITKLKKFLDDAKNLAKDSAEEVADLQSEIQDRQLQQQLDRWEGNYAQQSRILEDATQKATRAAEQAAKALDPTDEGSKEAALNAYDRAIAYAEQNKQLAESNKQNFMASRYEDEIQKLIKGKIGVVEQYNQKVQESVSKVKDELQTREEEKAALEDLFKREQDLLKERAKTTDPAAIADIDKQLIDVVEEIRSKLASDAAKAATTGIDKDFAEASQGFQRAMDAAHFNWAVEVERLEAELASKTFQLKAQVGLEGQTAADADTVTGGQLPGESASSFGERALGKAQDILKDNIETVRQLRSEDILRQGAVQQLNAAYTEGNNILNQQGETVLRGIQGVQTMTSGFRALVTLGLSRTTQAEQTEQAERLVEQRMGAEIALMEQLGNLKEQASRNEYISQDELTKAQQLFDEAVKQGQLDDTQKGNAQKQLDLLTQIQERQRTINKLKAETPQEEVNAAQRLNDALDRKVKAEEEAATKAGETQQKTSATVTPAQQVGQGLQNAGQGAEATAQASGQTLPNLVAAASAASQLAAQLERAAVASQQVSVGGGAVAYHGGPMRRYFAAGGNLGQLTRGQDKIFTALSAGETVINSKNSRRFFSELNAMNQGNQPVYREQGGPVTNVGDINVSVNGGDSSQQTVREIAHALRREVQRGNIKLR